LILAIIALAWEVMSATNQKAKRLAKLNEQNRSRLDEYEKQIIEMDEMIEDQQAAINEMCQLNLEHKIEPKSSNIAFVEVHSCDENNDRVASQQQVNYKLSLMPNQSCTLSDSLEDITMIG